MKNKENYNEIFGKRLSKLRKDFHKSQQELADLVEYESFQSISNIENGKQKITKDKAKRFAEVFGVNPNYFLDVSVEYPTFIDGLSDVMNHLEYEGGLLFNAIYSLAKLNGYDLEVKNLHKTKNNNQTTSLNDYFSDIYNYMTFSKNGDNLFTLSLEEANKLGNNISDIFLSNVDLIKLMKSKNQSKA